MWFLEETQLVSWKYGRRHVSLIKQKLLLSKGVLIFFIKFKLFKSFLEVWRYYEIKITKRDKKQKTVQMRREEEQLHHNYT